MKVFTLLAALACLVLASGCLDNVRDQIPFMPPSKYVNVHGRRLTRSEADYYQKLVDVRNATRVNPKDAVAWLTLGRLLQKKGNYKLARDLYLDKAITLDDTLSEAHFNLGLIYLNEQRYHGALDEFKRARELSPDDAKVRFRLGQTYIGMATLDQAYSEFDGAIALDNEFTPAYLEKAKLLYSQHRFPEAADVCRTALVHVPKETAAVAHESRSGFLYKYIPQWNEDDEARPTYRAEAAYDLALCLRAMGRYAEALAALPLEKDAVNGRQDILVLKARLQDGAGDVSGALTTLDLAHKAFPDSAEVLKRMASLYAKAGKADEAAKVRMEAAELDQSDRLLQEEAVRHAEAAHDIPRAIAIYERLVRIDPDNLPYRRQLAKSYDTSGLSRQAALAYQEVVDRDPADMATRRRMGILFSEVPGFQGRAVLQFTKILEKTPDDAEIHRRLGQLYLNSNNMVEAERHIRATLQYDPNNAQAHQNLATLFDHQKRFEDAVTEYKKALAIDPKYALAELNLAIALRNAERREDAIAPLRHYLTLKPLDEDARRLLAETLRDLGRREEAIQEYEAIEALHPNEVGASLELAQLQTGLGKQRSAIGVYEAILDKHPSNVDALREAGRLYTQEKMPLRAVYCWQRLLNLLPDDLEAQTQLAGSYAAMGAEVAAIQRFEAVGSTGNGEAWKRAADLHIKRNERDKAIADLREVVRINGQDAESRRTLAGLLQAGQAQEDKDEALKLYREVLTLDQKDNRSRLNLANLLCETNQFAVAQDEYEAVLKQEPQNAPALLGMGVISRKRQNYKKAVEYYQAVLKLEPDMKEAHLNLGLIYDFYLKDASKLPEAREHYRRYLELGGKLERVPEDARPVTDVRSHQQANAAP